MQNGATSRPGGHWLEHVLDNFENFATAPHAPPSNTLLSYKGGIEEERLTMNAALFWSLQVITCSLPLAGAGLFAYILLVTTSDTPITEWSVSDALAAYPDYQQLLVVLIIAASLIFAATATRNVQIRIWFRRRYGNYLTCCCRKQPAGNNNGQQLSQGSVTYLASTNDVASVVNVAAYISFLILAIVPTDAPTQAERNVHNGAAVAYFSLSITYAVLQVLLTCKQGKQYPKFVNVVQLLLALATTALSIIYVVSFYFAETPFFLVEWLAVIFNLAFIAFFAVLFHYDSAADELVEYLCPCCCKNKKKSDSSKASYYRNMP